MHLLKRFSEIALYAVLGVALCASILWNQSSYKAQQEDIMNRTGYPPAVSQPSPAFTVESLKSGEAASSDTFWTSGRSMVVFSYSDCSHLAETLDALDEAGVPPEKVRVVFVDVKNGDESIMQRYISEYPGHEYYVESEHSATWAYKIDSAPHLYIYDEAGVIVYRSLNGLSVERNDVVAKWVEYIYQ